MSDADPYSKGGAPSEDNGSRFSTAFWVVSILVSVLALLTAAQIGPIHSISCALEGRNGWTIDLPESPVPVDEFEALVKDQSGGCVDLVLNGVVEPESNVVAPIGAKTWVDSSRVLQVEVR